MTTVFAFTRAYWGPFAGVLAAALVAVAPASQDILGWHGLANLAALVLLALLLGYLPAYARGALDPGAEVGLALSSAVLAAAHRLSAIVCARVAAIVLLGRLVTPGAAALRDAGQLMALTIMLGAGVIGDLYAASERSAARCPTPPTSPRRSTRRSRCATSPRARRRAAPAYRRHRLTVAGGVAPRSSN